MSPHPDHEFMGADPDEYADLYLSMARAELDRSFDALSRAEQHRAILDLTHAYIEGTPLHEALPDANTPSDLED